MPEFLPRLREKVAIGEGGVMPSSDLILQWQTLVEILESVPAIQEAVTAAQEAADAAQIAADQAQAAADEVGEQSGIASSWVKNLTMEAENDGADCSVTISAHTRVYGDGTEVAVNAGGFSGIPHDTIVRVYYDDPDRAGGAVTYQWTSDIDVAAQAGDRHSVGAVVTPRAAEIIPIIGTPVNPPGYAIP